MTTEFLSTGFDTALPFESTWFRFAFAERRLAGTDTEPLFGLPRRDLWVIDFKGRPRSRDWEYEPKSDTLADAVNLKMPDDVFSEPPQDLLDFLKKWGPIGLIYYQEPFYFTHVDDDRTRLVNRWLEHNELYKRDNAFKTEMLNGGKPLRKQLYKGYSEHAHLIMTELKSVRETHFAVKDDNTDLLNQVLPQNVKRQYTFQDGEPVRTYEFLTLRDALFLLLENSLTHGRRWKTCRSTSCGREFDSGLRGRKYCHEACRKKENQRKVVEKRFKKPIERKKHNLRMAAYRRRDSGEVENVSEIIEEIRKVTDERGLKRVVKLYPVLKQ